MSDLLRPEINFNGFLSVYLLVALGVATVLLDAFLSPESRRKWLPLCGAISVGVVMLLALLGNPNSEALPNSEILAFTAPAAHAEGPISMLALDSFSRPAVATIFLGGFLAMLLSADSIRRRGLPSGEFVALMMFALAGTVFFAASRELLTMFLSIEILSLCLYILVAMDRRSRRASEASFKYFILGAFSSAFLVLGIAFVFGATGTTYFTDLQHIVANGGPEHPKLLKAGFALLFVALCFKLALAPFHMYAPDVYEGAPAPVAAVIATVAKVAGFVVLVQIARMIASWSAADEYRQAFERIMWIVAALSVVIGNIAGVLQRNIKRMLAYSSVAHSGYLLMGVMAIYRATIDGNAELATAAERGMLVYLIGYTAMNMLAFGAAGALGKRGEMAIADYGGLARRQPAVAAGMALAMISLTGIPPTVGFVGKYLVFAAAIHAGYTGLAILAVLASVASAFYYLRVVVVMYMKPAEAGVELDRPSVASATALAIGAAVVILFGIVPDLLIAQLG